jgi:UDP-N-acetylglucosamine 2-epimerase
MAPLVSKMEESEFIESVVCVTAQHREMLDQVLKVFQITPHYDLDIMQIRQSLLEITTRALKGLNEVFHEIKPDIVLVHGDTTTTFAGSLAAFYNQIKVGHVEAGLRTFNKYFPYPEEMNRKLTGSLADFHFAPTATNKENLVKEGVDPSKIYITGNTVIDALKTTIKEDYQFCNLTLQKLDFVNHKVLTVTAHRRENLGEPLKNICGALKEIAMDYKDVIIVYPVHLNPQVKEVAMEFLKGLSNVYLIEPLDVQDMHNLMARSHFILTDSGGLQEEAPSLGKPVLVLRNETERPEAVKAGTVKIAGTKKEKILALTRELLEDQDCYKQMARAVNPYGDGLASQRILEALLYEFGISYRKPNDFLV